MKSVVGLFWKFYLEGEMKMGPIGWFITGAIAKDILGSKECKEEEKKPEKRQMTHEEMFPNSSPLNVVRKDREK